MIQDNRVRGRRSHFPFGGETVPSPKRTGKYSSTCITIINIVGWISWVSIFLMLAWTVFSCDGPRGSLATKIRIPRLDKFLGCDSGSRPDNSTKENLQKDDNTIVQDKSGAKANVEQSS